MALIVNEQDEVLMLWRYRFATEQWGYELLGGLVEGGEDSAARRRGRRRRRWGGSGREPEKLISFEPLPGKVTAPVDVFLWRSAERIGEPTDTEETGRVEWVPLSRVTELARGGAARVGDLVGLLYYLAHAGRPLWAGRAARRRRWRSEWICGRGGEPRA